MNELVTIREVMTRSFVGVTEGDQVAGVAKLLADEDTDCAIVMRGSEAIGLVHAMDIIALVASGRDLEDVPVSDVMQSSVTEISVDQSVTDAISALRDPHMNRVIVTEDDAVVGVMSESDILTVHPEQWYHENGLSEAIPVATTSAAGQPTPSGSSMQGVCEVCGSLSSELTEQNGQFVCSECLSI